MRRPTLWLLLALTAAIARAQAPEPAITLRGRIVTVTGDGVPAASVQVNDPAGTQLGKTVADGDGYFQVPAVPPLRELDLRVSAARLIAPTSRIDRRRGDQVLEVTMVDALPLAGAIKTNTGGIPARAVIAIRALPDANVTTVYWQDEAPADERGRYQFAAVPALPLLITAWAPGHEPVMGVRRIDPGVPLDFELPTTDLRPRTVTVRGVPAGVPATVFVENQGQRTGGMPLPRALAEAPVGADGTAELWPLTFAHVVGLHVPGCTTAPLRIHAAENSVKPQSFEVQRTEPRPLTTLRGILVDELGHPLPDLLVRCAELNGDHEQQVRTGADGTFAIETTVSPQTLCRFGLPPGIWRMGHPAAQLDHGGITWWDTLATPTEPIKLHSRRGAVITGVACDDAKAVLRYTTVELLFDAAGKLPFVARTISDRNGRFAFQGVPGGSYRVQVQAPGRRLGTAGFKVAEPGNAEVTEFTYPPCGEVTGVLRDDRGNPLAGVNIVDATREQGGFRRGRPMFVRASSALTDRAGRFRMFAVQPGARTIVAQDGVLGQSQPVEVNVEPATAANIDLTLARK
ncbi:MAG: carboxypeptidase regulatory-like domain-containing protein [Planctomycetes bacterium]|nr:carboxypeptidase regulatory-like domain-containing protein [Planctomycetota bacterium]